MRDSSVHPTEQSPPRTNGQRLLKIIGVLFVISAIPVGAYALMFAPSLFEQSSASGVAGALHGLAEALAIAAGVITVILAALGTLLLTLSRPKRVATSATIAELPTAHISDR